ncbi:hypothetical protein FPV67DRAFT_47080 [Lyophyllum atratum]|nr:hypothetical protein FPV67DRAFT_47080 [Lyophyllum atratum]
MVASPTSILGRAPPSTLGSIAEVNGLSPWSAGLKLSDFAGATTGVAIVEAAKSIKADILSLAAVSDKSPVRDPTVAGYVPFTTKDMIDRAHEVGMLVIPWTLDRLSITDQLLDAWVSTTLSRILRCGAGSSRGGFAFRRPTHKRGFSNAWRSIASDRAESISSETNGDTRSGRSVTLRIHAPAQAFLLLVKVWTVWNTKAHTAST